MKLDDYFLPAFIFLLILCIALAGCTSNPPTQIPAGHALVRDCAWSGKIIMQQESDQYYFIDPADNRITPIAPGALLDDICRR
jgi:hypothetical protein